jgi:hypothetical protein
VPSLDLRFADNKSLVDAVSGQNLITFTRASSATFIDSTGTLQTAATDVPRFDHNPTTGESLGLLVEEQRTNLSQRSEEFDNAYWTPLAVSRTPNATASPSGLTTADLITEDSNSSYHEIYTINSVSAETYTFSIFVKNNSGTRHLNICFSSGPTNVLSLRMNAVTGSLSAIYIEGFVFSAATSTVTPYPNGWYRASISFATIYSFATQIGLSTSSAAPPAANYGLQSYAGDGTSGVFLWGAQLETGAFPTSYIPTTTAAATRAADVASITGITVAPGCIFAQFSNPASGSQGIVSINDNTANNRIELRTSGTDPFLTVVNGGATQADIDAGTIAANLAAKLAGRVATDNFGASASGGTEVLDSSGTVPSITQLQIGRDQAGNYLNGRLARLALLNLSNTTLQRLTQ